MPRLSLLLALVLLAARPAAAQNSPLYDATRDAGASAADAARLATMLPRATQEAKLTAEGAVAFDQFGASVSISGDRALVGAVGDDARTGAAYVFAIDGTDWVQQHTLTAGDASPDDYFGFSVSLSGDRALIGAAGDDDGGSNSGSAYVFAFDGTGWTQQAKLTASDAAAGNLFGSTVSLSGDHALVGALADEAFTGAAYVFASDGTGWTQQAKLTAGDADGVAHFGNAVSLSGDRALVGARLGGVANVDGGAAYVFARSGSSWGQEAKLTANDIADRDQFGWSVALSGDRALVGARYDGDNGSRSGSAYVFVRVSGAWEQEAKLTADDGFRDAEFGDAVALSGERALVGASHAGGTGAGYVFALDDTGWTQQDKLTADDFGASDELGVSVSLSGERALMGAPGNDDAGSSSGSAYVFAGPFPTAGESPAGLGTVLSAPSPNPAARRAAFTLTLAVPQHVRATLVDALGRTVAVLFEGAAVGTVLITADTSALPPGVYTVSVRGETVAESRRLTVVR